MPIFEANKGKTNKKSKSCFSIHPLAKSKNITKHTFCPTYNLNIQTCNLKIGLPSFVFIKICLGVNSQPFAWQNQLKLFSFLPYLILRKEFSKFGSVTLSDQKRFNWFQYHQFKLLKKNGLQYWKQQDL